MSSSTSKVNYDLFLDDLEEIPKHLLLFINEKQNRNTPAPSLPNIGISPYRDIVKKKIKEGGRNDALFKRLCQLRSAPFSYEGFLATARAENLLLCDILLDDSEVMQISKSAFYRYQSKEILEPKISLEAFHGILGKLINLIKDETEASTEALLFQALVILGNLFDRKFHVLINGLRPSNRFQSHHLR